MNRYESNSLVFILLNHYTRQEGVSGSDPFPLRGHSELSSQIKSRQKRQLPEKNLCLQGRPLQTLTTSKQFYYVFPSERPDTTPLNLARPTEAG